jgi:hypothetical protein
MTTLRIITDAGYLGPLARAIGDGVTAWQAGTA